MLIPPFNYKEFFEKYQCEYWAYKLVSLKNILDNFEGAKPLIYNNIENADDDDCKLMLKAEIHFTYYQVVETLFEIMFGLQNSPELLWFHISFSKFSTYEKIRKIANGEIGFLSEKVLVHNEKTKENFSLDFIEYIFYGQDIDLPAAEKKSNFNNIRLFLDIFAKDFTDRGEYNAYKHSLRILPCKTGVTFSYTDEKNKTHSLDLKGNDGFQYLEQHKLKNGDLTIKKVMKSYDTERDFKMAIVCCQLISNLIKTKKAMFFGTQETVYMFHKYDVYEESKQDFNIGTVAQSIEF